jgi:hypothetical protein
MPDVRPAAVILVGAWVVSVLVLSVAVARLTASGRTTSCREPARSGALVVCLDHS